MNKLIFGNVETSKKSFYKSKQGTKLKDIDIKNIVVSNKIKINDKIVKYYFGYIVDDNVIPLILLLPIMSGWIKYFENGGKNMSFNIEDDDVYVKYNNISNKIKNLLNGIRLTSDVIYGDKYIKTKVKTFKTSGVLFNDNIPLEEKIEYECIPCISIDSVLKIEKNIIHKFI